MGFAVDSRVFAVGFGLYLGLRGGILLLVAQGLGSS